MNDKYVLITPAKNEAAFIELPIISVIYQTVLPQRWIIVSDGSTDRTDEIVSRYAQQYDFIRLVRLQGDRKRNFGAKVAAFNQGLRQLEGVDYDFIGMLDADISFKPDYYEQVLAKFHGNKKLGIAGGIRFDLCDGKFIKVVCAPNSVGGPYQMFRRRCFEDIGGFIPIEVGGEDAVAEITARMLRWEVRSFPELQLHHYRCTGTAELSPCKVRFRDGQKEFLLGYHPLFEFASCLYRVREEPFGIFKNTLYNFFRLWGYFRTFFRRSERPVTGEFVNFLRSEQIERLRTSICSHLKIQPVESV